MTSTATSETGRKTATSETGRKFYEITMQQELCKMISTEFENVDKMSLTPFMAVMRMIKLEYTSSRPEIYKMLVSILHDYNPAAGAQHKIKTDKYINILLCSHPELADYLISILPPPAAVQSDNQTAHTLHTVGHVNAPNRTETTAETKRPPELMLDSVYSKKLKKTDNTGVKFYNFTTPAVNAYVASQGVPTKITSMAGDTALRTTSVVSLTQDNVLVSSKGQKTTGMESPLTVTTQLLQQEFERRQKLGCEQRHLVRAAGDSVSRSGDVLPLSFTMGVKKAARFFTGNPHSVMALKPTPILMSMKHANALHITKKQPIKMVNTTTVATAASHTAIANALKCAQPIKIEIKPESKDQDGKSDVDVETVSDELSSTRKDSNTSTVSTTSNSFPYGQQMLLVNGVKQNVIVATSDKTPLQCLQLMVDNTGKSGASGVVGYFKQLPAKDSVQENKTGAALLGNSKPETTVSDKTSCKASEFVPETIPDKETFPDVINQPVVTSPTPQPQEAKGDDYDPVILAVTQLEDITDDDGVPSITTTDTGFEPSSYLARLTNMPAPPTYDDPWQLKQLRDKKGQIAGTKRSKRNKK